MNLAYAIICLSLAVGVGTTAAIVLYAIFTGITPQLLAYATIQAFIFTFAYKRNPVYKDVVDMLINKMRGGRE